MGFGLLHELIPVEWNELKGYCQHTADLIPASKNLDGEQRKVLQMDMNLLPETLFSVLCSGAFVILVVRQAEKTHRGAVERAEQIIRCLSPERIVDDPRILSQPEVPERIWSLMMSKDVESTLKRAPVSEVVVLPSMRLEEEKSMSRVGTNVLTAFMMTLPIWGMYSIWPEKFSIRIGFIFFLVFLPTYSFWRARKLNFVQRAEAERLLRRMTRSEIIRILQTTKAGPEKTSKPTNKDAIHPEAE